MWSTPAICRATVYGFSKEVDMVPISPMCVVRAAMAESVEIGSK